MAEIRHGDAVELVLGYTRIGREPGCDVVIDDPKVSGTHAAIRWARDRWELLDLGSRNGTSHNGAPVPAGTAVPLALGDTLSFAGAAAEVLSIDPPEAMAISPSGDRRVALRGLLTWGDEENDTTEVYRGAEGEFVLDQGGEVSPLTDRQTIHIHGVPWVVRLPGAIDGTVGSEAVPVPAELALTFAVSADEEHVQLTATWKRRSFDLGKRAHNYLLVTLARLRLEHADDPEHGGWVDAIQLARMLRCTDGKLNLDVFRIRRQLADAGIHDAASIVERRRNPGALRLGATDITVVVA
jgi:hypothetical protein